MTNLASLGLRNTQVTDAGLKHVKVLTSLTVLGVGGKQITGPGLVHLKGLTSLRGLIRRVRERFEVVCLNIR